MCKVKFKEVSNFTPRYLTESFTFVANGPRAHHAGVKTSQELLQLDQIVFQMAYIVRDLNGQLSTHFGP